MTVQTITQNVDRERELLDECEVVSALLSESCDTDPDISQKAGAMLSKRISEIKTVRRELNVSLQEADGKCRLVTA